MKVSGLMTRDGMHRFGQKRGRLLHREMKACMDSMFNEVSKATK